MKTIFSTFFVFRTTFLFLLYAASVAAQPSSLQNRIDGLLNDDFFQRASIGISVYDLTANRPVYQNNEKRLCRPASNMKLLTSAAALQFLTPTYEFRTELFHTGTIDESGKLKGDIYLLGGFDPELSSADLDTLVLRLKKAGIADIEGRLYIDTSPGNSAHWGKAWSWDDDLSAFQPYLSPLPLNKDLVKVKIIPAAPNRPPIVKTDPESSFIRVINQATTVWKSSEPPQKSLSFDRDFDGTGNRITVSGIVGASTRSYEKMISLKDPQGYILTLLYEKISALYPESRFASGGSADVPVGAQSVGYIKRCMPEVVKQLNKESDNLNAEMLLYVLGYQFGGKPSSTEKGIETVQKMISEMGFDPKKYSIVDGSGLSNQNYLSPELMTSLLTFMYRSPNYALFKETLPVAGVDGTLAHRMRDTNACRKVFAKTGSMTGVNTLSGYASASNGHILAFSIMVQNFTEKTSYVSARYIDKICDILTD